MNLVLLLLLVTSVITTFSAHIPVKGGRHRPHVTSPIEDKAITQSENKEDAAISSDVNLKLSKSSSLGEAALGINESTLKGQQSTISEERTHKDVTISADGELEREVKKESSQATNIFEENHHSKTLTGEKHLFKKTIENQNQDKVVVREQTSSLGDASFTSPKQVKLEDEHKILITDEKNTHKIVEDTLNDKKINQEETSHLIHNSHTHHSFPDNIHHEKQKTVITHDVIDHEKDSHRRHELNINIHGGDDKQKKVIIKPIPPFGEHETAEISTSAPFPKYGGPLKFDEIDQKKFEEKIGEVDQKKVGGKIDQVFEGKLDEKVQGSLEVATGSKVHNIHHDQKILPELDVHKKDESPHHHLEDHHGHDLHLDHDQKHLKVDVHKKDESHHEHHLEGHHGHNFHPGHDQKHLEIDAHQKHESHPHFNHEYHPYHGHHSEHHHDFLLGKDQKHLEDDKHKRDESHHEHDSYHGHHHDRDFHPKHDQKHLEVDVHKKDESHHTHHGHDFHPGHDQKHLEFDAHHLHFEHKHHPYHGHQSEYHHDHDFHLKEDKKHLEDDEHEKDECHHEHDSYHGHHWEGHHDHDFHPEHDQKHLKDDAHHAHFEHEHHPYHGHHWEHHHEHDFHPKHDHEPPSHKLVPKDLPKPIPPVVEEKQVIKTDDTRIIEEQSGNKNETAFELETNIGSVKTEEEEKEVKLEVASVQKEEGATEGSTVVGSPAIFKDIHTHHHVPEHDIHDEHHHHHIKHIPVKGGRPHKHDDYHEEKYHHHSQYDHHDYSEDVGSPYHSQWTEI